MAYIDKDKIPYYLDTSEEAPMEGRKIAFKFDIDKIPPADVVEVKHSRWENISGFDVCNICGTSPAYCEPKPNNPKGYPPYCHNCGAKMDVTDTNVGK